MDLYGLRATVMGLGHFGGGVAVARWLARHGAAVTVTDLADEKALAEARASLEGEPIAAYHLGGHREGDFHGAELVVVNPAVRPGNPFLELARQSGARLATEIELFLEACPARAIGVSGSNGKSTTAAMTAAILRADGRRVYLGGNLGGSLLDRLDQIAEDDWAVLEISSFQLFHAGPDARMPEVAILTGCTPNHLDWHGTFAHYAAAKQRMLTGQKAGDLAVLNSEDPEVASWAGLVRGRLVPRVPDEQVPPLAIPGRHNRLDARLAAAAALAVGCSGQSVREGLASFRTLPGRLEMVAMIDGRRFYNDTTATTPESTIAALEALEGPIWLLAGGGDKGCAFGGLAGAIVRRARGAALYGAVGRRLADAVLARQPGFPCTGVETMAEALRWCWGRSRPADDIVLSPACTSHDQFQNFRQRGAHFLDLLAALADPRNR
jgi:UDP-N-acetylmuramoylalanine--D-glutamate ligase